MCILLIKIHLDRELVKYRILNKHSRSRKKKNGERTIMDKGKIGGERKSTPEK